jgi:hypothetical protein
MAMNSDAYILREGTGTSGVLAAAQTAAELLAEHDIPHLIVGGIAVQEHGYPRVTIDVDVVVPDVLELILRRHLPRSLAVNSTVRLLYEETWDAIQAEK